MKNELIQRCREHQMMLVPPRNQSLAEGYLDRYKQAFRQERCLQKIRMAENNFR